MFVRNNQKIPKLKYTIQKQHTFIIKLNVFFILIKN